MDFTKSNAHLDKALKVIPVGSQTFSKGYQYYPVGASPLFLFRGDGSHVWDIDGNEYIDFVCALGPITLGYNYKPVNLAMASQLAKGIILSLPSPLEVEMAELLNTVVPCSEMVRFFKTGSEACNAAIRVARAYTKRELVLSYSYHGWGSEFAILTDRNTGIPYDYASTIIEFSYNDIEGLDTLFQQHPDQVACIIMEPVVVSRPKKGYLEEVKMLCESNGSLLIWDEVVTGFRWALGGASEYFGIVPHLSIIGKGCANGASLAAVCGPKPIMQKFEDVMVSSTFAGNCVDLAAGIATIHEMQDKKTVEHCWQIGHYIMDELGLVGIQTMGYPCRPMVVLPDDSPEAKTLFLEQMLASGILLVNNMVLNICYSHSREDARNFVAACRKSMDTLEHAVANNTIGQSLRGSVVRSAFRRI